MYLKEGIKTGGLTLAWLGYRPVQPDIEFVGHTFWERDGDSSVQLNTSLEKNGSGLLSVTKSTPFGAFNLTKDA